MKVQYKVGDLVQLKSGGPTMTVTDVNELGGRVQEIWYDCAWFAGRKKETGRFPEGALRPEPTTAVKP